MADNEPQKLGVYKAILAVAAEISVGGIAKDKQAKRDNGGIMYNFRGIDDIYNTLSPILAKHKLVILPRVLSREVIERQAKSGGALFFVTVEVEYQLVSAEDGSVHSIKTFGEAQDSGDKATNKALSAAYKYMAIQVFCIPVEGQDDADNDQPADVESGSQKPAKKAANSAPAPVKDAEPPIEPVAPVLISADRAADMETLLKDSGLNKATLLKFYKVEKIEDLTVEQAKHAFDQIEIASKKKVAPPAAGGKK